MTNHLKTTNSFKSNGSSVHKSYNHFNVKREQYLNIERKNTCLKRGGTFSKRHFQVCPAKDTTCTSCHDKDNFIRLCTFFRKKVSVVNTQVVDNTDSNYLSDPPDVKMDHVNR